MLGPKGRKNVHFSKIFFLFKAFSKKIVGQIHPSDFSGFGGVALDQLKICSLPPQTEILAIRPEAYSRGGPSPLRSDIGIKAVLFIFIYLFSVSPVSKI